jgi:hypothetical protein
LPNLQTKAGKEAQGVTSMEFVDIMGQLKATMDSPQMTQLLRRSEQWLYSWDNDKIHQGAVLTQVDITEADRFELPELSSDMHKVVEHVHAWLQAGMQQWLEERDDAKVTVEECKAELRRLFEQPEREEGIMSDVASLKATYQAVIDRKGGYIPAADR